jgi:cation diffusion facilitator CzcD-associated flavoprotein CzcO
MGTVMEQRVTTDDALPDHVGTVIVGSGFAGLCTAIKLDEAGRHDYLILERGDDVGGTWRDNSYPGCACDVPSHLYSFSFSPNPDWLHSFSRQPQILDYLRGIARDYGVLPHVRLRTAMTAARWDDATSRWTIETERGSLTADRLVSAMGPLSAPSIPAIPGIERFEGTTFHSAAWDHDHDLSGERVAVIGTGASAIQFVPHVQKAAGHLTLFQRTAPWVLPRRDRRYAKWERQLNHVLPAVQRSVRALMYTVREILLVGFTIRPNLLAKLEKLALRHLRSQVSDPVLQAKLTPNFRLGCKRILASNDYYPALAADNAEVVTDRIVEVLPHAVVTQASDGSRSEHATDTIIYGTGFRVTEPPAAEMIWGSGGRRLAEAWADNGMSALHGLTIAGFPNLFFLIGPNTGLGHTSIVVMIEAQVRYLVDLLGQVDRAGLGVVEAREDVQRAYNTELQRKLVGTVWDIGGCNSWYLDKQGRNTTLWPTFTFTFMRQLRTADLDEYDVRPAARRDESVPA